MRFALGLDDDHSEFVRRFANDPLLGETLRQVRGLRPMRTATVAQALLRAVAGQLILASARAQIERRDHPRDARPSSAACMRRRPPPSSARFSPAQLARFGLGARRAAALIRLCRSLDLEGLKEQPTRAPSHCGSTESAASGRGRSA